MKTIAESRGKVVVVVREPTTGQLYVAKTHTGAGAGGPQNETTYVHPNVIRTYRIVEQPMFVATPSVIG